MLFGKCFSAAFGPTSAEILAIKGSYVGGGIRARVYVRPEFRERYYLVAINGSYIGTYYCEYKDFDLIIPPNIGNSVSSFFIEDVGLQSGFKSEDIPYVTWQAKRQDATTANRLNFTWDNIGKYKLSSITGDTQISGVTITGARRDVNVEPVNGYKSRGRLYYTLTIVTGVATFVRWWNGDTLVAEGYGVSSSEAVVCSPVNGSGLTVNCTYTYSSDVKLGAAWLDLKWPERYQIHFSTSALSYPRTPEATVYDDGTETYAYITGVLPSGFYNFNVVCVDDEGNAEASPTAPGDSPLTIYAPPTGPTITNVSGSAGAGLSVTFTNGEAGCTYKLYYSKPNAPINFGDLADGPTPIGPTATDATSATTAAITGYTATDNTTDYTTALAAFDSAVDTCNTAFGVGEAGFATAFNTLETSILSAVNTFGTALKLSLTRIKQDVAAAADTVQAHLAAINGAYIVTATWKTQAGQVYGEFLKFLGSLVEDNAARYTLPNGAIAGGVQGGETRGDSLRGTTGATIAKSGQSLLNLAKPFVKPGMVRLVVRATKSGTEEQNGTLYEVEFDNSGNIVNPRPAQATIARVSKSSLTVTVTGAVVEDDASAAATHLDLYIYTSSISLGSPSASVALPTTGLQNYREATFAGVTVGGSGWYKMAVLARTVTGTRSASYEERYFEISTDTPVAAGNVSGHVVRSRGR